MQTNLMSKVAFVSCSFLRDLDSSRSVSETTKILAILLW